MMPQAQSNVLRAVNYYRSSGQAASGTGAQRLVHFRDQDTSATGFGTNDLPQGRLPDNRNGDIIGVMFQFSLEQSAATTAAAVAKMKDIMTDRYSLKLKVMVAGLEVISGPLWAFPHPPAWLQGGYSEATASLGQYVFAENAGYPLVFISHPVTRYQGIQVVVEGARAVGGEAMDYQVWLQVADNRPIADGGAV